MNNQESSTSSTILRWGSPSQLVAFPGSYERIFVSDHVSTWSDQVKERLEKLIQLENGWDGYNGMHVSLENAHFALNVLAAICETKTPAPQIVPGDSGDLQLEWHTLHGDLEMHIIAPNQVHVWRELATEDNDGIGLDLRNDFSIVAKWLQEITEPEVAIAAAA